MTVLVPAPPPLPVMPRGGLVAEPTLPRDRLRVVRQQLEGLALDLRLDVAVHLRPGPTGVQLTIARPGRGGLLPDDMDRLCGAVREFAVSTRLTTDDFDAADHHCVAFGPRPLGAGGLHVLGRRHDRLSVDERWAVHRRLAMLAAS